MLGDFSFTRGAGREHPAVVQVVKDGEFAVYPEPVLVLRLC